MPFTLQNSKSLILRHAARVGNNRHRVFVLLCARCLKPCLHGVRLQPLAQPSSKRKEAQGENALCLHAEVSVSDKCRERLERRVRYDKKCFLSCLYEAESLYRISVFLLSNLHNFNYKVWRFYGSVIFDVKGGGMDDFKKCHQLLSHLTDFAQSESGNSSMTNKKRLKWSLEEIVFFKKADSSVGCAVENHHPISCFRYAVSSLAIFSCCCMEG